ncbi:MAG TPA: FtsX-like permease family protein [Ignavibacteriaceae bacterium]|nr:FtsX-like permease family protein [Ignavibacteriaceae bacterium]
MKTYITLAWRNLWRNKRRTLIAASSVFFAVILALLMRSMQTGYYDYMIDSSVRTNTGHIQIQGKEYWEKRSFEESMILDDEMIDKVNQINGVELTVKRLETFSLISYGMVTRVVQVVGIDPEEEDKLTSLKNRIVKGEYLTNNSKGIILSEGLADLLNADIGDSILIYGQGLYGITAAELIPVQAIARFSLPAQNKAYAYLSLPYSQWVYSAPERLTSLSIMIENRKQVSDIQEKVRTMFNQTDMLAGEEYDILSWEELSPELVQYIQIDNAQGIIMLGILYIVIAFGIFGTIMMMTAERVKEFGILLSVGMKKWKLYLVTTLETIFISFIGVVAGAVVSLPLVIYFVNHPIPLTGEMADTMLAWGFEPILPFALYPGMFIAQVWTVLAIAIVSGLYPINFIRKIKPVEAMRG